MHRTRTLLIKIVMQAVHFIIVLLGISFLTFSIMHLSPRNPAELWLVGADGSAGIVSEEAVAEQERIMGLDRPFLVQYGTWLGNAVRGDLGTSFTYRTPVTEELAKHMAPTAGMTVIVVTVTVLVSVPLGILCAVYKDRLLDQVMRVCSFVGISLPSFLISILFLWLFCMRLGWFTILPEKGMRGILLPSLVLIVQFAAKMTRQVRAIVLEQLEQPYVDGAVIRGVRFRTILFSHVLKNSAAPILACISLYVGLAFGGSAVIEGIFSVNGLGRMIVSSVGRMDIPVIQGYVFFVALVYLAVNLLTDILAAVIDPRIKYERGAGGGRQ